MPGDEAEEEVAGWESAAREAILRLLKATFIQGSLGSQAGVWWLEHWPTRHELGFKASAV